MPMKHCRLVDVLRNDLTREARPPLSTRAQAGVDILAASSSTETDLDGIAADVWTGIPSTPMLSVVHVRDARSRTSHKRAASFNQHP